MPIVAVDGRELPADDRRAAAAALLKSIARTTLDDMSEHKLHLGGMAPVGNGVLVHGPTSWACAVRTDDGQVKVVAERKRLIGSTVQSPLLRGPARLVEAFAVLPRLKRALPEAKLPFERGAVAASLVVTAGALQGIRRTKLGDTAKELLGGALSVAPAVLCVREGSLAAYHGAEHITIGSYEHGEKRAKEHERCGSHLVGPLLATATAGNVLAARAPAHLRPAARLAATVRRRRSVDRLFGMDAAQPGPRGRPRACPPGPRAPASARNRRAERRPARGRRGRPSGLPRASSGVRASSPPRPAGDRLQCPFRDADRPQWR